LRRVVSKLDDPRLDTPYRPDGSTVRQVVHSCAAFGQNGHGLHPWPLGRIFPQLPLSDNALFRPHAEMWVEIEKIAFRFQRHSFPAAHKKRNMRRTLPNEK
jgi:hypothetical protein